MLLWYLWNWILFSKIQITFLFVGYPIDSKQVLVQSQKLMIEKKIDQPKTLEELFVGLKIIKERLENKTE